MQAAAARAADIHARPFAYRFESFQDHDAVFIVYVLICHFDNPPQRNAGRSGPVYRKCFFFAVDGESPANYSDKSRTLENFIFTIKVKNT